MFKYFLITFSFCVIYIFPNYAQVWEEIDPAFRPTGNYNMFLGTFVDKDYGWSVSRYGKILHTVDGGKTWKMQKDSNSVGLYDIDVSDSLCGWISGITYPNEIPFLWRTIDGGNSWSKISMPDTALSGPFVIHFFDSLKGFAGGWNNEFYYTDNGGKDWQDITGGKKLFGALYDIFFYDSLSGWAVGESGIAIDAGVIINSLDGGKTWQIQLPETLVLKAIYFSNSSHGCAVGTNVYQEGVIMITNDGGKNWENIYLPCSCLNDIVFTDDSTGWVVGNDGFIWFTKNGGKTWKQVESRTDANLNRIVFVENGNIGYIFGNKNTLLKYNKNGNSTENTNNLLSQFSLLQNYPNPFNTSTIIEYKFETTTDISVSIYDLVGKEVITLYRGEIDPGSHQIVWDGKDEYGNNMSSGIYFYVLQTESDRLVRKMILMR